MNVLNLRFKVILRSELKLEIKVLSDINSDFAPNRLAITFLSKVIKTEYFIIHLKMTNNYHTRVRILVLNCSI